MRHLQVAAGIVWRGQRFLASRRLKNKPWAGYWELPGGKQKTGEHILETLGRELREELGICCEVVIPWRVVSHNYPDLRVTLHFAHVTAFTGAPHPKEGQELRWVTPKEAARLTFLPADVDLLPHISRPHEKHRNKTCALPVIP